MRIYVVASKVLERRLSSRQTNGIRCVAFRIPKGCEPTGDAHRGWLSYSSFGRASVIVNRRQWVQILLTFKLKTQRRPRVNVKMA